MKITYLLDQLGSGGCEHQLSELAIGMKNRGHEVKVCVYYNRAFYDEYLEKNGIEIIRLQATNKYKKVYELYQID